MHYAHAPVPPLLDYPTQVSELEKIAQLSPSPAVQREPPGLADADADAAGACLVCGAGVARACAACGSVSYCGEAHQAADARWHDLVCADLQAIAQDVAFAAKVPSSIMVDALIERIERIEPARISDLASWDELLEAEIVGAQRRLLSDLGTRPLTLARVLADLELPARAARPGVLSIHVMAAAEREREVPLALWATLPRLFPGTRFELALVGPELDDSPAVPVSADSPLTLRARTGFYRRGLWTELGRPDLVLGYDCGLLLYPSWKATILELRGSGVPFAITSYRSWEAAAEAQLLTAVGVTRVQGPAPNPFASLASQRSSTIANDVARDNAWVTVWR